VEAGYVEFMECLREETGWSFAEQVRRGARALDALIAVHREEAERIGSEGGKLYRRLGREIGFEFLTGQEAPQDGLCAVGGKGEGWSRRSWRINTRRVAATATFRWKPRQRNVKPVPKLVAAVFGGIRHRD
jgi:hypothetical protein